MASLRAEVLPSGVKSYAVRWVDPKTRKLRNKRFKKHSVARDFKSEVEHGINTGTFVDSAASKATGTVADIVDRYISTNPRVKESTREQYESRRLHVVDRIGNVQIRNLERSDVEAWRDDLVNDPDVGVSAAFNAGRLLKQALNFAVKNGRLDASVATGVEFPKPAKHRPHVLTEDEAAKLAAAADAIDEQAGRLVRFLAGTGVRISEACALRVRDLDFEASLVRVEKGATKVRNDISVGTTKTGKDRVAPLPPWVSSELRRHIDESGKDLDDLVFTGRFHGYLTGREFRGTLHKAAIAAGVTRDGKPPRIHDLRHVAASLWRRLGVQPVTIKDWLGHEDQTMTSHYSHAYQVVAPHDIAALGGLFAPDGEGPPLRAVSGD